MDKMRQIRPRPLGAGFGMPEAIGRAAPEVVHAGYGSQQRRSVDREPIAPAWFPVPPPRKATAA